MLGDSAFASSEAVCACLEKNTPRALPEHAASQRLDDGRAQITALTGTDRSTSAAPDVKKNRRADTGTP